MKLQVNKNVNTYIFLITTFSLTYKLTLPFAFEILIYNPFLLLTVFGHDAPFGCWTDDGALGI